ncbi:hypothetical protein HOC11_07155 [archaeon]|nr:hypothetical protein [archaeon]
MKIKNEIIINRNKNDLVNDLLSLKKNVMKLDELKNNNDVSYFHFIHKIKYIIDKFNINSKNIRLKINESNINIMLKIFINENEIVFEKESLIEELDKIDIEELLFLNMNIFIPMSSTGLGLRRINDAGKPYYK